MTPRVSDERLAKVIGICMPGDGGLDERYVPLQDMLNDLRDARAALRESEKQVTDLATEKEIRLAERDAALAQVAALREALDDATDVLAIFRLFQSATKGMKAHWPVVQYGNQTLTKAAFDDALETHENCQATFADTAAAAAAHDERVRREAMEDVLGLIEQAGYPREAEMIRERISAIRAEAGRAEAHDG